MGEELRTWHPRYDTYVNTTLHTNFLYFQSNVFARNQGEELLKREQSEIDAQIAALESKELSFYRNFGIEATNADEGYKKFMQILKDLTSENGRGIGEVFKRLRSENVSSFLSKLVKEGNDKEKKVPVTISVRTITKDGVAKGQGVAKKTGARLKKEIEKSLKKINNTNAAKGKAEIKLSNVNIDEKAFSFVAIPNVPLVKAIINQTAGTRFVMDSYNSAALRLAVEDLFKKNPEAIVVTTLDGKRLDAERFIQMFDFRPLPWGYTNSEIAERMRADPVHTEALLERAIADMRSAIDNKFFYDLDMYDPDLKKIKDVLLDEIFDDEYNIFFQGGNWKNGLRGAFGEFGTTLLLRYLYKKYGGANERLAAIIVGHKGGKQDVNFLNSFGVQVKNYAYQSMDGEFFTYREIKVNQNLGELSQYDSNLGSQSFIGFITNYFFNAAVRSKYTGTFQEIEVLLRNNYQAELLRSALDNVDDTLCFYNIDMTFFIPGSLLLRYYSNKINKLRLEITGKKYGWSVSRGENDYWEFDNHGLWKPTAKNYQLRQAMIDNDISFHAILDGLALSNYRY